VRKQIILTLTALLIAAPAFAWHAVGHKATASVAYDALSAARRQEVIAVLREHPRFDADFEALMPDDVASGNELEKGRWLLEQASIWPDLIQTLGDDVRRDYNRSRWHYINLPVWLTEQDETALSGTLDHNMSTEFSPPLRQNLNIIQALRGNLAVWNSDRATPAEKAVALCWIVHLTGDLHQPLHTVALFSQRFLPNGDRGGNEIEVVWGDDTRNLHAVWDGLPTNMESLEPTERTLRSIREDVVDDAAIDEWLYLHASLARKFVYTEELRKQLINGLAGKQLPNVQVSHDYLVAAESIARRQVNLAGHRIAALLH